MNIHSSFKNFIVLCALSLSYAFAAQPAQPPVPASLQAPFAAIETDDDILIKVYPCDQSTAERGLERTKQEFRRCSGDQTIVSLVSAHKNALRAGHKYCVAEKEMQSCNDPVVRQQLQSCLDYLDLQRYAVYNNGQKDVDFLTKDGRMLVSAYNYRTAQVGVLRFQASILLVQKEKAEAQWQQEKQTLQAQLRGYQLLVDGRQIEGMPNVPGGPAAVKPKLVRRGSH